MRRIVVALVVALIAVTLTACGGGGEEAATEQPAAPEAAAPAPASGEDAGIQPPVDSASYESTAYAPLISEGTTAPPSVTQRVKSKKPFVLVFYDESQPVTDDQKRIVAAVMKRYRGLADLVSFDVGKYVSQSSSTGESKVDADLLKDKTAVQAVELAESLGVKFTPTVVVVDKNGYTTYVGSGLVDDGTLEREVLRVGE